LGFFLNGAWILHFIGPNEPTINYSKPKIIIIDNINMDTPSKKQNKYNCTSHSKFFTIQLRSRCVVNNNPKLLLIADLNPKLLLIAKLRERKKKKKTNKQKFLRFKSLNLNFIYFFLVVTYYEYIDKLLLLLLFNFARTPTELKDESKSDELELIISQYEPTQFAN
jgi:IS4 transposase